MRHGGQRALAAAVNPRAQATSRPRAETAHMIDGPLACTELQ
jgi:hypothetical protein